jgi:serine/threonine protein kinase
MEDKETTALVAVKKIFEIANAKDQRSFIREIVVPLKLNLPGIVKLIGFRFPEPDTATTRGSPALIITELMQNGTLDSMIKAKHENKPHPQFGATEFSKAIFGIASTMAQVHKRLAIHRDLKPGNVFLDEHWEVRIADFGLAKVVTAGVKMTMAIGSPMFMAPELFNDDDAYSFSVDVFAFGVMMYTIFTKEQVLQFGDDDNAMFFTPRGAHQMMMKVADGYRFKKQPEVPDAFWELITACWAQLARNRPTFDEIVKLMLTSDEFVFEGTDMARYREYRERVKPPEDEPIQVDVKQNNSGGLLMSQISGGNQLLADEMAKSLRKSMSLGSVGELSEADQAYRRYDFTRSSLRKPTK